MNFQPESSTVAISDFVAWRVPQRVFHRAHLMEDRFEAAEELCGRAGGVSLSHDVRVYRDGKGLGLAPRQKNRSGTGGLLREFRIGILLTANNVRALPAALKSNLDAPIIVPREPPAAPGGL